MALFCACFCIKRFLLSHTKEDCMRFSCHFAICTGSFLLNQRIPVQFSSQLLHNNVCWVEFIYLLDCWWFFKDFRYEILVFYVFVSRHLAGERELAIHPNITLKSVQLQLKFRAYLHTMLNITKTQSKCNRIQWRCNVCPFHFLPLAQLIFHNIADQTLFIHLAVFRTQMKRVQLTHTRPTVVAFVCHTNNG